MTEPHLPSSLPPDSSSAPPLPSPQPYANTLASQGQTLALVRQVQARQRRQYWAEALSYGLVAFLSLLLLGLFVASLSVKAGVALLVAAFLTSIGLVLGLGAWRSKHFVGDEQHTARLIASKLPDMKLDALSVVELTHNAVRTSGASVQLARAFIAEVDRRAGTVDVRRVIDGTAAARAMLILVVLSVIAGGIAIRWSSLFRRGATALVTAATVTPKTAVRREPITGDFEITYRFPAHTGLEPRTIVGSSGELSAPAGTEVQLKTRADRDVSGAELTLPERTVPLTVNGRNLSGTLVLEKSSTYHVSFLNGTSVVAAGPEMPIQVELDQAPQVRLTAPADGIEIDRDEHSVTLRYEVDDDYGVSKLELVARFHGREARTPLKADDGRTTRGSYIWALEPLALMPGDVVEYHVEAFDNDSVKGPKVGASRTQKMQVYSSSEHRRAALAKTEQLWERLVTHLADRMDAPERKGATVENSKDGASIDARAFGLASELRSLSTDLLNEREPLFDIVSALSIIGTELEKDVSSISNHRRLFLRLNGSDLPNAPQTLDLLTGKPRTAPKPSVLAPDKNAPYIKETAKKLVQVVGRDIQDSEKNVLYLESLIDRVKLDAIRDIARELQSDRRELSRLIEEYQHTQSEETQKALLEQMEHLRSRMEELQKRMMELAQGIRDEFMNQEALQQMQESQDFQAQLDEIEKLIREGNVDEAMKKMQEFSMQMDEFLDSLDRAEEEADEQADPELSEKFEQFSQKLDETINEQTKVADQTRQIRDKYRQEVKRQIEQRGAQLKQELKQRLNELEKSYDQTDTQYLGPIADEAKERARDDASKVRRALDANDFELAAETALHMAENGQQAADEGQRRSAMDSMYGASPQEKKLNKQTADRLEKNAQTAEQIAQSLQNLFPQNGANMNEGDKQNMKDLAKRQRSLQQDAQSLQQQMNELSERAPIFDEDAKQQMQQAGQRMQSAGERLGQQDAQRGVGDQQAALQGLRTLKEQMQQGGAQQGGRGRGLPRPGRNQRSGNGGGNRKVEIPDEDPNQASRDFRKDVMDAMKQGAPERYKDQNKKYYEELVQ